MIVSLLIWETPYIPAMASCLGEEIVECRTKEAALEALPDADIAVVMGGGGLLLDDDLLDAAKKLKVVLSISAGIEKLPMLKLHERGIAVCNSKGAQAGSIAEFVLGAMLCVSHDFPLFMRNQQKSVWQTVFTGQDLDGKTLIIVGAGNIGQAVARRAKAFNMTVLGIKRRPAPLEHFDAVYATDALTDVLPRADYVVLTTPLTPDTYRLIGADAFDAMKPSAVFINVSRGDIVDESALISALQMKQIAGAVLDVFHTEPLPPGSPFWTMENVLVTPHSSGPTDNAERKTIELLCENVRRFQNGQPLLCQVEKGSYY